MKNTIIGAIAGDVIGSVYEWNNIKTTEFPLFNEKCKFTDDSVLTMAVADCILNKKDYSLTIWEYARKYTGRGYGGMFRQWITESTRLPYNSFGNGSAMRVSPVGFAYETLSETLDQAAATAAVTHNHPEGIKGAQAVATVMFMARNGSDKETIKNFITETFNYDLSKSIDEIRPDYKFNPSCQGSVPQAIQCFLESSDYESAIRLAISIGGDSDTIACIVGGMASAYYKHIPQEIIDFVYGLIPEEYKKLIEEFDSKFGKEEENNKEELKIIL